MPTTKPTRTDPDPRGKTFPVCCCSTMTFGKYLNRPLCRVPPGYLSWLESQPWLSPPLLLAVRGELLRRQGRKRAKESETGIPVSSPAQSDDDAPNVLPFPRLVSGN